ncbi:MAG: heparinase II/III family protein [Acidobacteriota bacterium]
MMRIRRNHHVILGASIKVRLGLRFFAGFIVAAFAAAAPGQGSAAALKIPQEHPRIFFTKVDIEKFKTRLNGPYVPQEGNDSRTIIRENAFAYVVSGDKEAAAKAIEAALKLCTPNLGERAQGGGDWFDDILDIGICYDWCYPVLGDAKEKLGTTLINSMDKWNYTAHMSRGPGHNMSTENSLASLAAGLAMYGEAANAEKWLLDARRVVVEECMEGYLDKFCPDGDDMEGTQYHGARYQGQGIWCWIWFKATGENLFTPKHPQLINAVNWWIYMLQPFFEDGRPFHLSQGDTSNRGIMPRNVTSAACLSLAAKDAYAGWYASQGGLTGWEAIALQPELIKAPGEGLPLYKFFRPNMAIIRSGWNIAEGSKDTQFTFTCRDYMQGWHCHQDVNHFTVSRRGELAIDSGVYAGNSDHARNYERATVAHNSILVYDPAEPLPPEVTARDGGQVFRNNTDFVKRTGAAELGWKTYDRSDFRTFGVGDGYYYMCGDGTNAYNYTDLEKVENFTREAVYIAQVDPPVIVIFDRVTATKPASKKTWLLHTIQQPKIDGSTVIVNHREGRLTVQSLLPKDAAIVSIGGPGKQFWVADPGQNYPANRRRTDADDMGWHGNWRVEISPPKRTTSDQFLTVLYPCDPGSPPPVSKLIEAQDQVGCKISVSGKTFKVVFNTDGPAGGTFNGAPFSVSDPRGTGR